MKDKNDKKKSSPKKNEEPSSSSFFGVKFAILTLILIVGPAVLLAKFSLIQLNFDKPLKANYIELPPFKPMEGNLGPNKKLEQAKLLGHGKLGGPETIVFTPDGTILTGLMNGQIVRVKKDGSIEKLTQIGDEKNDTLCNDYGPDLHSHKSCGRPLGLRLRENWLYVADAYYGILKVNIATGEKKLILSSTDKRFGEAPMKMTNDLDLDSDIIYFIDSSYEHDINEAIEEHMEALPRGRLFSYNEKTNELAMLLDNLYLPNGLQLLPNKEALLINENSMARIIKFNLKGEKKGFKEVFADLPGFGDTIRLTDRNTLLVPFAAARPFKYGSTLDLTGKIPFIRTLAGFVINMRRMFMLLPKYGLLAEYDLNGKPLRSWHDPEGKMVQCVTSAAIHDKKIYLGSFYNDFIAVADY